MVALLTQRGPSRLLCDNHGMPGKSTEQVGPHCRLVRLVCLREVVSCSTGGPSRDGTFSVHFSYPLLSRPQQHQPFVTCRSSLRTQARLAPHHRGTEGVGLDLVDWCEHNHLLLKTNKTTELVVDTAVNMQGSEMEIADSLEYLGVQKDPTGRILRYYTRRASVASSGGALRGQQGLSPDLFCCCGTLCSLFHHFVLEEWT